MSKKLISGGKIDLPPKWEDGLRKGIVAVGGLLEKVINKAESLSSASGLTSRSSVQPVLSLEGQLALPKLKELINLTVDRMVASSIPGLIDRTAAEVREGPSSLAKTFREKGASLAVHIDMGMGAGSYGKPEADINSIRSSPFCMPFEDGFFDLIVGHYASQYQRDIVKDIKELSRTLAISGEGIIVDFHPFGMFAKRGAVRLRPVESTIKGVEDYFRICKQASLKVQNVREAFFDESLRPFFATDSEKQAFRIVKESPFLIFLYVKKGGG